MSKRNSDQLHKLIHALTKQEKRHFKIFSGRHTIGEENNYVRLFDAIEKMKEYNEESLLRKFNDELFTNNFSITKNRLYEVILRSLDVFHHNSSVDAQLWKELHYAEILFKKTLYDQCAKRLKAARKLAEKYEKNAVLVQIHTLEKSLAEKDGYAGMSDESILEILHEDNIVADHIRTYNELWNVKSRLFLLLNTKGRARGAEQLEQFKDMIDASLGDRDPQSLTVWSRFMYHHTYSAYYFAISDAENCHHHLEANVQLIESNTAIFSDEPNVYFGVLTNLIYVCSRLKRNDEVLVNLTKLRALPEKLDTARNEDLEVKLFASSYSLELTLYNSLGQFDKAVALIPGIVSGLERFEGSISKLREAHFCISCAVACFGAGQLQQSLRWTSRLLNDPALGKNEWIFAVAQVFSLILHIEMDHKETLPYVARNVQRYLKTRNRAFEFEHVFLAFAEKVAKVADATKLQPLFTALAQKLKKLEEDPFEKSAFEYFDFPAWAESKASNRLFGAIVRDKNQVQ